MNSKLYLTIIATAGILFGSCERDMFDVVKGQGPVISEDRTTPSFEEVSVSIPADVYIYQGHDEGITIEAQGNVLDVIETEVRNHELKLKFENGVNVKRFEPIKIFITTNDINEISVSGSGNVYNETPIITSELRIQISGSGNVDLHDIDTPLVDAKISGSGKIYLSGYCEDMYLQISGSGNIHAFDLMSETADVEISGSGKAEITATDYLNAQISGSGSIYYKGHPDIDTRISGSGGLYHVQ
jgi:hypothetical protein